VALPPDTAPEGVVVLPDMPAVPSMIADESPEKPEQWPSSAAAASAARSRVEPTRDTVRRPEGLVLRAAARSAWICVLLWASAGCGGGSDGDVVQVEGEEYAYQMPDRVDGGFVTMEFSNSGDEVHEWALGRLKPGRSEADLRRDLFAGNVQNPGSIDDVAGVPAMTPGASLTIARELEPGQYVFFCSMPAPNGQAHFQLGMIRSFVIEGATDAKPPDVDGTITAREASFEMPTLEPGTHTLQLENAADDPREFKLLSLKPGERPRDLERWFEERFRGDPPADLLGVVGTIPPGSTAYATIAFEAGRTYHLFDGPHRVAARFQIE
jgi:hypothetical protein